MQKELPGYNMEIVKKRIRELQEKHEKEINEKVYDLYGITDEEKKIIEDSWG